MSIEMDNPQTVLEKLDAISNLVEQMFMAHTIRDEEYFKEVHRKAGKLCFDAARQLERIERLD